MDGEIGTRPHKLAIQNRAVSNITGIQGVIPLDENQVVLDTDTGLLTIKGKDMYVSRLTLEKGEVDMEGTIDSLAYSSNTSYGRFDESVFTWLSK